MMISLRVIYHKTIQLESLPDVKRFWVSVYLSLKASWTILVFGFQTCSSVIGILSQLDRQKNTLRKGSLLKREFIMY